MFLFFAFLACIFQVKAQTLSQLPVQNVLPSDTSKVTISLRCPSANLSQIDPLLIIDGKRFKMSNLSNIYFSPSVITSLKVYKNFISIIKYGRKAKSGVILIKTKGPVKWVSNKSLSIKYTDNPGITHNMLFIIDGKPFTSNDEFYIDADYIKSMDIRSGDAREMYNGKNYNPLIKIELKK